MKASRLVFVRRLELAVLLALGAGPAALAGETQLASVDSAGGQGDGTSWNPSVSARGRFVAFESGATNLVPGDTNGESDIFVHDRKSGLTTRVSLDSAASEADSYSYYPSLSGSGRFVAFASEATNLVAGDSNDMTDVFLHDRKTGLTTRVSVSSEGLQADGHSYDPSVAGNGRFIAFVSEATDLVAGDSNDAPDIFVHDRKTGLTARVSVDAAGIEADSFCSYPSISASGRFVAFESSASNLVAGDANEVADIFVHDRKTGLVTRVSTTSEGGEAASECSYPSLSANGRFVAYQSFAADLVAGDSNDASDIFVHDRKAGLTVRASVDSGGSEGNDDSRAPSVSGSGRFVAFYSSATNLVASDANGVTDIFVHDRMP
jgi:Tol biopolymer transport system component